MPSPGRTGPVDGWASVLPEAVPASAPRGACRHASSGPQPIPGPPRVSLLLMCTVRGAIPHLPRAFVHAVSNDGTRQGLRNTLLCSPIAPPTRSASHRLACPTHRTSAALFDSAVHAAVRPAPSARAGRVRGLLTEYGFEGKVSTFPLFLAVSIQGNEFLSSQQLPTYLGPAISRLNRCCSTRCGRFHR